MGALIETSDTLRITREQGFPQELDITQHLATPYNTDEFQNRIFEFHGKERIRVFPTPPIRTFLVEDIGGKWVYWGHIHILEVKHDYQRQETGGRFQFIHIFSPDEMRTAFNAIDRIWANNYFGDNDA